MTFGKYGLHPKLFVLVKQESPWDKITFEKQTLNGVIEYIKRWEGEPTHEVLSLEQFYERIVTLVSRMNYKVVHFEN